eukprot:tig00021070_g17815.t1
MAAARGHWRATVLLATCLALFALAPSPAAGELVLTPTNPPSGVVLPALPFGDSAFAVEFWVRLRGRQRSGTVLFYAGDAPAAPPAASPASLSGGTVPPNSGGADSLLIEITDLFDEDHDVIVDGVPTIASVLRVTAMRNGTGGYAWITGDFPRNAWHRLAFSFRPAGDGLAAVQAYSNGTALQAPITVPMPRAVPRPHAFLGFAGPPASSSSPTPSSSSSSSSSSARPGLAGSLAGFRFWADRTLSQSSALCGMGSAEFSAPDAAPSPGGVGGLLLLSLPLAACSASVPDAAGSNRTATLSGAGAACNGAPVPVDAPCSGPSRRCTLQSACGSGSKSCVPCPAPGYPVPLNGTARSSDPKCPVPGGVRIFREGDGYIHIDPFPFGGNLTIELWAYFHKVPTGWERVFDLGDGVETNSVMLHFSKSRQILVPQVFYTSYDYHPPRPNVGNFPAPGWVHLAVTWQATGAFQTALDPPYPPWAEVSFYWNGTLVSRGLGYLPEVANRTRLWLGRSQEESDPAPDMTVSELRIWNRTRTQSEVVCSMRRALLGTEDGLLAYWTFEEGRGNRTRSVAPGGIGATLRGAYEWSSAPGILEVSAAPLSNVRAPTAVDPALPTSALGAPLSISLSPGTGPCLPVSTSPLTSPPPPPPHTPLQVRATASRARVRAAEPVVFTAFADEADAVRPRLFSVGFPSGILASSF